MLFSILGVFIQLLSAQLPLDEPFWYFSKRRRLYEVQVFRKESIISDKNLKF